MKSYQEEKKAQRKKLPKPFQRQNMKMKRLMENQQPAIVPTKSTPQSVASPASEKPECVHCGKRHGGNLCWTKTGRCLKCGSSDHRIRECPKLKKFVPRGVPTAAIMKPTARPQEPARAYVSARDDTDDVTRGETSVPILEEDIVRSDSECEE
ncbi:hypothetical protein Taro_041484 [Colocasia esculenta]|uniref:CCHC-type domain-containing protein n=1 Tax=Colocasia esculenta TaxID=4460 RepID=A0A843WPZ9_COLES|nr:hypothetical protein [Colocasia esculenta]